MEFKMINLIKANPILYEYKFRGVRYRHKRLAKWEEIAAELGRDASSLRIRWKTLRDTYRRLKKMREEGEDMLSLKYWKYFDHMTFLEDQRQSDNLEIGNDEIKLEETTEYEIMQLEEDESTCEKSNIEQPGTSRNGQPYEIENFDLNAYIKKVERVAPPVDLNTSKQKSIRYEREDIISEACQEMTSLLKNAKQHFTPPSANQLFFNSLAAQVEEAKLPAINVMRLQQRILEVVTQEIVLYQEGAYEEV